MRCNERKNCRQKLNSRAYKKTIILNWKCYIKSEHNLFLFWLCFNLWNLLYKIFYHEIHGSLFYSIAKISFYVLQNFAVLSLFLCFFFAKQFYRTCTIIPWRDFSTRLGKEQWLFKNNLELLGYIYLNIIGIIMYCI